MTLAKRTGLIALALLISSLFVVSSAQAQQLCECFCTSPAGAVSIGSENPTECRTKCEERDGAQQIVCALNPEQAPSNLPRCFPPDSTDATKSSICENQGGEIDRSYQPPECPEGYFYCYAANQTEIPLSVEIGGITSVTNIAEYIDSFYTMLLAIAGIVATVFVLIGGLQYVLGAASQEQVAQGKKRIMNGVTGLVILLGAALLLETVNPQLRNLQPPRLPLVKQIDLVDEGSCESLLDNDIVDESGLEFSGRDQCGTVAKVTKKKDGTAVPDGTTCLFKRCTDESKKCIQNDTGYSCASCEQVFAGNPNGFPVNASVCAHLSGGHKLNSNGNIDVFDQCVLTRDPELLGISVTNLFDAPEILEGSCARVTFDCKKIDSCHGYDDVPVVAGNQSGTVRECLDDVLPAADELRNVPFLIDNICSADPCRVAPVIFDSTGRRILRNQDGTVKRDRCVVDKTKVSAFLQVGGEEGVTASASCWNQDVIIGSTFFANIDVGKNMDKNNKLIPDIEKAPGLCF